MAETQRRYWDSDAFLGWLKAEPDKVSECQAVIREAEAGQTEIVTSALTLAEVLYLRGHQPIPSADAEKLERFFEHEYIVVNDVDRMLAEEARKLVWNQGIRPKDAIHVATAIDAEVERLETFDADLIKRSGAVGNPPLTIDRPYEPPQLFDEEG
jgi:predicted nucleic acid-binding protein